ncbi:MAG: oligopeptidase B [Microscillaceae bacterium]
MSIQAQTPPQAKKIDKSLEKHGHIRQDPYYWLNARENPEVVAYLEAENAYTEAVMAPTKALQEKLFEEMKGRVKQTDMSVPYNLHGYSYYTRYEEGQEYPLYCRKKLNAQAEAVGEEEIMMNVNKMAEGYNYYSLGGISVSDDNRLAAYFVDTVGRRQYNLHFKNLETGEILPDVVPDVAGFAWCADNQTFFYGKKDPTTLRPHQVFRHRLGQDFAQDPLIFEEKDETFNASVFRTKSREFIMIGAFSTLSSEYRFLAANQPTADFRILLPREAKHEYYVDHFEDDFYIRTNWEAKNFRLMRCPVNQTDKSHWQEVIAHRPEVLLEGIDIFKDFLVLSERQNGLTQLRIRPWQGQGEHYLDFGESTYQAYTATNPEFDTPILRFGYTSLTTPNSTFDYDMRSRQKTLLKQQEVVGGYQAENYQAERLYATAPDGTRVPISLVYKKGLPKNGQNPTLLYGYGSYGISMDPYFSSVRLSLLDRGFVFAIAHIRGGEEMGRDWYDNGKMMQKKNTFTDFIACAEHLIAEKFTSPEQLFAQGGSAGGLLMGAVMNMRPDLFKGMIADVPFVDVVTTMLDESIPLTTGEYDEWGNPNEKAAYEYMLSYSPYDNVSSQAYPNLLVTTGFHDSQVQYWEPAKWVARLRERKTDQNLLLLKTDMEAGHGGKTGRFKPFYDAAFEYAFMLMLAGKTE